jgi:hypothetical protein
VEITSPGRRAGGFINPCENTILFSEKAIGPMFDSLAVKIQFYLVSE